MNSMLARSKIVAFAMGLGISSAPAQAADGVETVPSAHLDGWKEPPELRLSTYNVSLDHKRYFATNPRKYKFWTDPGPVISTVFVVEGSGTSTVDLVTATATKYLPPRSAATPGSFDDFTDLVEDAATAPTMTFAITTDASGTITFFSWSPSS